MKQTSIEWLQECMQLHLTHQQQMQFEGLFQQAKDMEKEQIIDAATWGALAETGEQYYKEKYTKNPS